MTTIAIKDNIIAADGQVTFGDTITSYDAEKVVEINGCLVAGAGDWGQILKFRDWFQSHTDTQLVLQEGLQVGLNLQEELEGMFYGVVLYPDSSVYIYEGRTDVCIPAEQPLALGSGAVFALAAMDAGAGAKQACEIAAKRDPFTGGEVREFKLQEMAEIPSDDELEKMSKEELLNLIIPERGYVEPSNHCCSEEDTSYDLENFLVVKDVNGVHWELTFEDSGDSFYNIEIESEQDLYSIDTAYLEELDLDHLKTLADLFEIPYAHNIKAETLAKKVVEFFEMTIIDSLE